MIDDDGMADLVVSVFADEAAEQAVLGSMLMDAQVIGEVESLLDGRSFHRPAHQVLFDVLSRMRTEGRRTDALTVAAFLAGEGMLGKIPGGAVYLQTLLSRVPVGALASGHYAGIVKDRAMLRDLDAALVHVQHAIRAGGGTPAELVERARSMISDLGARVQGGDGPVRWADLIDPALTAVEEAETTKDQPQGVPTGLPDLDRLIHGLRPKRLYVVAGIPGSGKSTLGAGDFVRSAAFTHKVPTVLFSLEMTRQEIFNRLVCAEARVHATRLSTGTLDDRDWTAIARTVGDTAEAPLWIDDTPGTTMADIRVRARRLKQREGLGLVVIDYLALISTRSDQPRNQQIDELTRQAKLLAGELDVPVVLLAQMNRNYAQRAEKRPLMSDLKESGGIEAHADCVIFVHREEQFDRAKAIGEAELIVAKSRGSGLGTVEVAAQLHFNRFMSMALPEHG
ncbi:replicative DNA helicase [Melissospora conviva]|uniref:replicative DNA helicase n=1 Tax=Melissospora conviva TaxID=3388432 RepID=UPI003C21D944